MVFASFRLFRPRHPLARLALSVLGVVVVVALLALSLFAVAALALGGIVFLLFNALRKAMQPNAVARAAPAATPAPAGVIEGEYTVVHAPTRETAR